MNKLTLFVMVLAVFGCATPSQNFQDKTIELGFSSERVKTSLFQHQIYISNYLTDSKTLHVYLDGDGTPWERKRWIASDPTARNPLILRLMKQDKTPSILLGRPCYYGLNESAGCTNKLWTSHRYAKEVVASMAEALNNWLAQHSFKQVVLIGYSGGGSLAVLMADKIKHIKLVATVAANLDVRAWSEFHGYLTLKNSLNPIEQGELSQGIKQIHFAGKDDQVVPAFVIKSYAQSQKKAKYYELEGQNHACCWEAQWQSILEIINGLLVEGSHGQR